jgi:chromate transporter
LLKYAGVKAFLSGIRPCIVGLILATAITMFMSTAIGFRGIGNTLAVDFKGIIIFAILIAISIVAKLALKKKPSPILMILISAGLGMLLYSL